MERKAQPVISEGSQQALNQDTQVLQDYEDLSAITIRTNLNDAYEYITPCTCCWQNKRAGHSFTLQTVVSFLPICDREYLQTMFGLQLAAMNRTLMHRGDYGVA